jgi:hypothetical protein
MRGSDIMADSGENPRHQSIGDLIGARSVLPPETRILSDIALVLSIVLMAATLYVGIVFASAIGRLASGADEPGPAPTTQPTCINGVDPLTGAPC